MIPDAVGPGSIEVAFSRAASLDNLQPTILSRDPFVVQFDEFTSAEAAAALASHAESVGFGASGSSCGFKGQCNSSSLSCMPVEGNDCWEISAMRDLEGKMLSVLQLPADNCEPLRFFRYEAGEAFDLHHDAAGEHHPPNTPGGPRAWTLYVLSLIHI